LREITDAWTYINDTQKRDELGLRIMKNILDLKPSLGSLFSFKDEPNLLESDVLKTHYRKVLSSVDLVVANLHNSETLKSKLRQLGATHSSLGV
jgi:broad-specificity NMP kinase